MDIERACNFDYYHIDTMSYNKLIPDSSGQITIGLKLGHLFYLLACTNRQYSGTR